jgi:hypothetical protein
MHPAVNGRPDRLAESVAIQHDLDQGSNALEALELLAATFPVEHAMEAAAAWGVAAAFKERFELRSPDEMRDDIESAIDRCRSEVGEARFEEAWARGYEVPLEDAIERALSLAEER